MAAPENQQEHRTRLRERFAADDGASMPDYELLELILFNAIPRRDTKPLAKRLIARFGSLASVLAAELGRGPEWADLQVADFQELASAYVLE